MNNFWNRLAAFFPPDAGCSLPLIPAKSSHLRRPNRWLERCRLTGLASLVLAAAWLHGPVARAGFTLEMDVVRANPYGYSFGPNFMTNAATSDAPYGDYYITSYGYPTNGAAATYRYDTNGLAWLGSSYWGYNDYDTLIHDLTFGPWSILFTNASLTNVYYFNVTANLVSNEVPFLEMIHPTNGEVEVPLQPTFIWSGPTNYTDLVIYSGDESAGLPVTQTDWSDWTFSPGTNSFTVHYDLYDTNSLVSSVPLEAGGNSLAGWSSTAHLQDYAVVQFVAGSVDFNDTLGTTNLTWATSGDSAWFAETTNTWFGSMAAAQSGSVTNSQSSELSTTVTGPGILTFYWASQDDCANFDYEFDIDGGYQADINCGTAWSQAGPFIISAGQHTLSWITHANGDTDPTEAGFLDAVSFTPGSAPVITVNPFSQTNYPGYSVALYAEATSNPTATWQWYAAAGGTAIPYATNALFIPTNSGSDGVAGSYYAVAGNPFGTASTLTATVAFMSAAAPSNWSAAFACELDNSAQGPTTNYNLACVLDATGNLYTVGSINGTNTFGSNLLVSVNYQSCASVLKQAAAGTPIWGLCVSNTPTGSSYSESVALAPGNGCYVAGNFGGTNWLGTNLLLDTAGASTFLARIDAGGNLLWVRTVTGGYNFTEYHELAADAAGNVTLSALISGATSFGGTNLTVTGQQGLLAQFDANGNVRWLQVPSAWPTYLVSDGKRLYGSMGGGATNYIGGVTNVSDRKRVLFCLNATNGQAQWLAPLGGGLDTGNPGGFDDDDVLVAVAGTNVFAAGSAWGSNAVFGSLSITFPAAKGQYLARYDADGVPQSAAAFGSQFTWPWAVQADAEGNVYVGGDFDTYSIFGRDIIAAPFYATVQSLGSLEDRIPGQGFLAKFDRNGNPLWARLAESEGSYLNCRDLALAADGIWACGFFNQVAVFGAMDISGAITVEGSGLTTINYHPDGFMAKMVQAAAPLPVTLSSLTNAGGNFQFSFLSQSAFSHDVQYRTNLVAGTGWQTCSNVTGDGTLKTIVVPLSLFSPARQGFIRVSTQ